jgi:fucose 4-O-acetylase-like acetyltransferase
MPAARARVRRDVPTSDRVAALDALRVVSMAAVVGLHASAAYMTVRIPGLIWLVHEPAGSNFVQQFAWWSYGATMPAFFALAGYAAAAVLQVKGTRGYALDRARRIGLPFLVALPAVLIPTVLIWMLGLYLAGRCELAELLALDFSDDQIQANRFGPAHLWFMAYLIPMLVVLGVVQYWCRERPRSLHGVLSHFCSPLAPLMLAIPTTLILWLGHSWNGVDPILDLRNSFLINPIRWLHHSLFFIAGLGWHSGRTRLPALTRGPLPWLFLAGSAVALLVRVRWLPLDLAASLTGSAAWVSVASASLFGWLTLYGSLGMCAHLARYGGRAIKYLSDSSYWVYLAHFPVVGLVQAVLFLVALPSPVKFLLAFAIGMAWCLLTYEACVRRTWIGQWLRGGAPRHGNRDATRLDHRPTARATGPVVRLGHHAAFRITPTQSPVTCFFGPFSGPLDSPVARPRRPIPSRPVPWVSHRPRRSGPHTRSGRLAPLTTIPPSCSTSPP